MGLHTAQAQTRLTAAARNAELSTCSSLRTTLIAIALCFILPLGTASQYTAPPENATIATRGLLQAPSASDQDPLVFLDVPDEDILLWTPVKGPDNGGQCEFSVYAISAFLDTRPLYTERPALVTFVAGVHKLHNCSVHCYFKEHSAAVGATLYPGPPTFGQAFQLTIITCPLATDAAPEPGTNVLQVGLSGVKDDAGASAVWLPVRVMPVLQGSQAASRSNPAAPPFPLPQSELSLEDYKQGKGSIAVCSPPLFDDGFASVAATFVEWVEFTRMMGAERIFTYLVNPGPYMASLVRAYQREGILEVYDWILHKSMQQFSIRCHLPYFIQTSGRRRHGADAMPCFYYSHTVYGVRVWGQEHAIQDCLYRSIGRYRWVAVVDFDEWITPRAAPDWRALLRPERAAYMFTTTVLCSKCSNQFLSAAAGTAVGSNNRAWPVDVAPKSELMHLVVPEPTWTHVLWAGTASSYHWGYRNHAKAIMDPLHVNIGGIHYPMVVAQTPYVPGMSVLLQDVPHTDARVYHVRTSHHGGPRFNKHRPFAELLLTDVLSRIERDDGGDVLSRSASTGRGGEGRGHNTSTFTLDDCPVGCDPYRPQMAPVVDYTILNVHGERLVARVQDALSRLGGEVVREWRELRRRAVQREAAEALK